jgi:hypothetical protein
VSLMDRQDGMKEDKKSRIGVLFLWLPSRGACCELYGTCQLRKN